MELKETTNPAGNLESSSYVSQHQNDDIFLSLALNWPYDSCQKDVLGKIIPQGRNVHIELCILTRHLSHLYFYCMISTRKCYQTISTFEVDLLTRCWVCGSCQTEQKNAKNVFAKTRHRVTVHRVYEDKMSFEVLLLRINHKGRETRARTCQKNMFLSARVIGLAVNDI